MSSPDKRKDTIEILKVMNITWLHLSEEDKRKTPKPMEDEPSLPGMIFGTLTRGVIELLLDDDLDFEELDPMSVNIIYESIWKIEMMDPKFFEDDDGTDPFYDGVVEFLRARYPEDVEEFIQLKTAKRK